MGQISLCNITYRTDFLDITLTYELESTINTTKLTMNNYMFTSNPATHYLSPSIFLSWSVTKKSNILWDKEIFDKATSLRSAWTKILFSHHHFHNEERTAETNGLIHNLASTYRATLTKYFWDF